MDFICGESVQSVFIRVPSCLLISKQQRNPLACPCVGK